MVHVTIMCERTHSFVAVSRSFREIMKKLEKLYIVNYTDILYCVVYTIIDYEF